MREAVQSMRFPPEAEQQLWGYLVMAADSMVNSDHDSPHRASRSVDPSGPPDTPGLRESGT
jgi:hypothetical protein